jgi:hypothetical protein
MPVRRPDVGVAAINQASTQSQSPKPGTPPRTPLSLCARDAFVSPPAPSSARSNVVPRDAPHAIHAGWHAAVAFAQPLIAVPRIHSVLRCDRRAPGSVAWHSFRNLGGSLGSGAALCFPSSGLTERRQPESASVQAVLCSEQLNFLSVRRDVLVNESLLICRIISHVGPAVWIGWRRRSPSIRVNVRVRVRTAAQD